MKKKIVLVAIASLLIVCAVAASATLAYFKKDTVAVTNTFVATKGLIEDPDPEDPTIEAEFSIKETPIVEQPDGSYKLSDDPAAEPVTANTYKVLPGTNLPKDPYVVVSKKSDVPAYLYIEVVTTLPVAAQGEEPIASFELEEVWVEVEGLVGPKGGKVYVYTVNDSTIVDENSSVEKVNIIKDKVVKIADVNDLSSIDEKVVTFYGYLAQASAGTVSAAFEACFLAD